MNITVPTALRAFARFTPRPLYLVGGAVRNALLGLSAAGDFDLCGDFSAEEAAACAKKAGLEVAAIYPRTHTVRLSDGESVFEFTSFRTEDYAAGGRHEPERVERTSSILADASRRDFTCNAIYFDIAAEQLVDPLGGEADLLRGMLRAADAPRIFQSDGLRLLRLARFAAELNLAPSEETLAAARTHAANIDDIAGERVFSELKKILLSDKAYSVSGEDAPTRGLRVLMDCNVLPRLLPFTALAKGMEQPPKWHDFDVLEHTFRAVRFSPPVFEVRLAALLHDSGKPDTYRTFGNFHGHADLSEKIARAFLRRLRAPNELLFRVPALCRLHMFFAETARRSTVRRFIAENRTLLPSLLSLMQADAAACKAEAEPSRAAAAIEAEWRLMEEENAPFSLTDLKINGNDLAALGFSGKAIGLEMKRLFDLCLLDPKLNEREGLLARARKRAEKANVSR